ncbi:hypothetical protein Cni_G05515 [Canna indica]|uniref:Uncharacterized protein n=1 Tax=Canna indica TaxID=4628 RepID=A0AAQ3JVB3_9LILI|nr:hypothetical protein Cni_G05515 [Canna indica]
MSGCATFVRTRRRSWDDWVEQLWFWSFVHTRVFLNVACTSYRENSRFHDSALDSCMELIAVTPNCPVLCAIVLVALVLAFPSCIRLSCHVG